MRSDLRSLLYEPDAWSPSEIEALTLHPTEPRVTRLLGLLNHDVADRIARPTLEAAGIGFIPQRKLTIFTGSDHSFNTGRTKPGERRRVDLAFAYWGSGKLITDCEVKLGAEVNGGWGYCPWNPEGYSDQILCYAHKCMFRPALPAALSLLILPSPKKPRWWLDRVDSREFASEFIQHARNVYENDWHKLALRDFMDCVDAAGEPALSDIIHGWMRNSARFA